MDVSTWICQTCTLVNPLNVKYCEACYTSIIKSTRQCDDIVEDGDSDDYLFGDGMVCNGVNSDPGWACSVCTFINVSSRDFCEMCSCIRKQNTRYDNARPGIGREQTLPLWDHFPEQETLQTDGVGPESGYIGHHFLDDELRIVLIGKTGSGKSVTGNTILGRDHFESMVGGSSVTRQCRRGTATRMGRTLQVIDTPALFDTGMTNEKITKEVIKCVGMTSPGPHAIILVTRIDQFTKEEHDTVEHFRKLFGEGMMDYLIVLFTKKDDLDAHGKSVDMFIEGVPFLLKNLFEDTNRRYIAFNNRADFTEKEIQVQKCIQIIDHMFWGNGGHYYSNEMFQEAEKAMVHREQEVKRQNEEKERREIEQVEEKFRQRSKWELDEHRELIQLMEARVTELKNLTTLNSSEESEDFKADLHSLQTQICLLKEEANRQKDGGIVNYKESVDFLENNSEPNIADIRERVRKEVEEESETSLDLIWNGLKSIGSGLVMGIGSFFKKLL